MAKPKGLIVTEELVAQEFNLSELLDVDLSSDETLVAEIGQDIADFIRERSADNKGIGGKALRSPYSKEYSESLEFQVAGKSRGDVNMKLTGDMLDSIEVLDFDGEVLTVGIEGEQAPKAHGHMTGKNGQVPKMKREFFGLTEKELDAILGNYETRIEALKERQTEPFEDLITPAEEAAINRLFRTAGETFNLEED